MNVHRENWAALREAAAVLGMTPEFYLNDIISRVVTEACKRDKVGFLAEEAQQYSYTTREAADAVADRINELSIVDHLGGSENVYSADVTLRDNGRFRLEIGLLRDGEWRGLGR